MNTITIKLDKRSYPVYIGGEIANIGKIASDFNRGKKVLIVSNRKIYGLYGEKVAKSLESFGFDVSLARVPQGERYKSLSQALKLYNHCIQYNLDRYSTILALGGGVIGDLAGFVASTYLRGINFISFPTTILAQVDASIGGKTAVNLPQGKNLVGSFYQPMLVYINQEVLKTLPRREIKGGLAEVVKYGVIKDKDLFFYLERNLSCIKRLNKDCLKFIITRSVKIKAWIVEEDEKEERGKRQLLNFGHTIGHAIEVVAEYKKYTHGEAVSIGMVAAGEIAVKMRIFSRDKLSRLKKLLKDFGLPTEVKGLDKDKLWNALYRDKKRRGERIHFVLPKDIGEVFLTGDVPYHIIKSVL
ncbi:3-dehydroquinate synthase [Candidatus Aerophobetes bacterium]|nr:3-dehydroquinate synthase [Candidatus Aerophobetes bacterium]